MTHRQSEVRIAAVETVDFQRNVGLTFTLIASSVLRDAAVTVRAGFRKYRTPAVLHSLRGVRLANKKNGGGLIDAFQLGLGPA